MKRILLRWEKKEMGKERKGKWCTCLMRPCCHEGQPWRVTIMDEEASLLRQKKRQHKDGKWGKEERGRKRGNDQKNWGKKEDRRNVESLGGNFKVERNSEMERERQRERERETDRQRYRETDRETERES